MEGVDLSLFQFDYDQTWCAFFLNADRTIYGRYGTRASGGADEGVDVSVAGLVKALEGALEIHAGYPANRASLAGKKGPPPPSDEIRSFPLFKSRFAEAPPRGCAHCHHVWEALRSVPREARRTLPDDLLWPFPKPDRVGLTLDLAERATVRAVAAGSAAARAGFQPGDRIASLAGQPVISIADVQWVLQYSREPSAIEAEVERGGARKRLTLELAAGWRRGESITWRASTRAMRPFQWEEVSAEERRTLGVPEGSLCVRVKGMPKVGPAQRAGLVVGDCVLEIDGKSEAISENRWLEFLMREKVRGESVALGILHKGKRDTVRMPVP